MGDSTNSGSSRKTISDKWEESGEERGGLWNSIVSASEEMGNSDSNGNPERYGIRRDKEEATNYKRQKNKWEWLRTESTSTSADSRFPARPGQKQYDWEQPRTSGYINRLPNSIRKLWRESRKGFAKMLGEEIWEETNRNIEAYFESAMGTTINGYPFREDLLRGAGNGVVWQTCRIAWIDLIIKHIEKK